MTAPTQEAQVPNQASPSDIELYMAELEDQLKATEGIDYGGSASVDLYGKELDKDGNPHRVKIMLTSHARTPVGAMENLTRAIADARLKYHLVPYDLMERQAPANKPAAPAQASAPAPAGAGAIPPPASAPLPPGTPAGQVPAGQAAPTGGDILVEKFEVMPRADGKADVKFFAAGHRYPDLTTTRTPEALAKLFQEGTGAGWNMDHFQKAGSYNVPLKVGYVFSDKKNSQGNPYKNLTTLANA